MRATLRTVAALAALTLALTGCDDGAASDDGPGGAGGTGGAATADMGIMATGLSLDAETGALVLGQSLTLVATVTYSDGSTNSDGVTWASSDETVATVAGGVVTPVAAGEATISAQVGDLSAQAVITVAAVGPERIEITGPQRANIGDTLQFSATMHYTDGTSAPIEGATFTVDDPRVLQIAGASGETLAGGPITVSVESEGLTGTWTGTVKCGEYPFYVDVLRSGSTAPPLNWKNAFTKNGEQFHFSLDDARCFADYADKDIILLVMGAGWCPACTQWTLLLDRWLTQMPNVEVVHIISQTADGGDDATSEYAQSHLNRMIGEGHGIRVGDADTYIENDAVPNFVHFQEFIEFFPTTFVVRKRDMRVVTDSLQAAGRLLPISSIAADPDADWTRPPRIAYTGDCAEGVDEATDAENDYYATATRIEAGTYQGGICNDQPDYYRVNVDGPWRATLTFTHADGDLGVYAYRPRSDGSPGFEPVERSGQLVGSDGVTDVETFDYEGAATIGITGFLGSVGDAYTLEIEAL